MSRDLKIFVVDTGPLITLAAARSLDYLLYANADIVLPDAVLHEATYDAARLGNRVKGKQARGAAPMLLRAKMRKVELRISRVFSRNRGACSNMIGRGDRKVRLYVNSQTAEAGR